MKINPHLSDLFFNLDFADARVYDGKGQFMRFDDARMIEEATWFASSIASIGGPEVTPRELVDDFYARV